ncbi:AraC family transcriptional activator of pyochelin receptor [Catalinimonas alkaloidigena]|uniref:helix-turn-helix domain-containing protein n=1 Tax=Catalinimonas alkaloidigena TaxID=1075417 RepID=UPI0024064F9B|nr:AraC family transcriptional regulator [Catalinimonas alkaloidigena]MDF9797937.1 AraC family transcriptional activator of pyochelin receptor [Catalinimonas alkaloidigena]
MTRDIIDINDFTILVEEASTDCPTVDTCIFDEPVIAVAFYGSGNVELTVRYAEAHKIFQHTNGLALSFYADQAVEFVHHVFADRPLQCIVIATATRNLQKLPNHEGELFDELLHQLVYPRDHYVEGPGFFMTPEMQAIVDQVFRVQYSGKAKMMFFRSQMTSLLAHFFGQLSMMSESSIPVAERNKLQMAREILADNLETPPSLAELSRQIGLNTFKLKKNFKAVFGVPVFKYLQQERLDKAYELIRNQNMGIQEAAWQVGYDSLSSFSNAFAKKFGFRPSQIKR